MADTNVEQVLTLRERSRAALNERQFDARRLLYSSTYIAHTPDYTIVDAQELTQALTSGRVAYDSSEYVVEYSKSHGPNIVVLLGVETVVPSAGRPNAGKRVARRFTDVYRKEEGAWRHDIRHAHIIEPELRASITPPLAPKLRVSKDPGVAEVMAYRKATLDAIKPGTARDPSGNYSSTFVANTPTGQIVNGAEMSALFASGRVSYARATQKIEYAALHAPGMVVLMGGEIVVPNEGVPNAGKNIHRRFTDVFRHEGGKWCHDLRHANIWKVE